MDSIPPYTYSALAGVVCTRVAGAGIEPASGGYEPPEVPLLYPAAENNTRKSTECNIKSHRAP